MSHWVGGTGTWDTTNANNWSNNPPAIFTATCAGTTLTVTSADFNNIVNGMTVWSNNYTILGTIAGGSYPVYTLSGLGGTIAVAEVMQAGTIPGSLPSASNIAIFTTIQGALGLNLAPFTVTLSGSLASNGLLTSGSALTLAGSPTLAINEFISISAGTTWNATGSVTLSDNSSGTGYDITTNGVTINSAITLDYSVNPTTSNLTLVGNLTLGNTTTFTLTRGGVVLGSNTFSMGLFSTAGTGTRRINFGTGKILLTGTGTVWTSTGINNFTTLPASAAKLVEVTTSAGATTINSGLLSEANALDFTFLAGSGTVTFGTGTKRSLDFSAYSGLVGSNTAQTIYGNVHFGSGTFTGGLTGAWTFASTSATPRTITSNGRIITFNLIFNGVGGKWVLQDDLLQSTARDVTHTNGTLDINAQTLTVGTNYTTATGTKNLTFNGGVLVCPGTTGAFNNAAPTNYITSVGTTNPVAGKIRMTSTSTKTFVGGGSTFNCTLDQAGTGQLTLTGVTNNTFNDIINSVQPATVRFTANTTTTFVNGFNLKGTAGNLITISSATAATHTLSKASGTVSCDYLSITNSIATGGASWYAGANSTNVSGNTGWIFTAPPIGSQTLLPSLVTNTNVFYLTTITQTGPPQTLLPDLYVNPNVFYAPTVAAGAVNLAPALYTNTNVFYAPTVSAGAVNLAPALYTNTNVFYSATVTPGAVNLAPALYVNPNTFYSATVTQTGGTQTLLPNLYTNTNVFYSPTVSAGDILAPELFVNTNVFYTPALVYPQIVYPDLFVNANISYAAFCYLYPFHPNDVRPGAPSAASGPRQDLPPAPNAARQNMPLSFSARQPMPFD
jgi:hypothetical protein